MHWANSVTLQYAESTCQMRSDMTWLFHFTLMTHTVVSTLLSKHILTLGACPPESLLLTFPVCTVNAVMLWMQLQLSQLMWLRSMQEELHKKWTNAFVSAFLWPGPSCFLCRRGLGGLLASCFESMIQIPNTMTSFISLTSQAQVSSSKIIRCFVLLMS